MQRLTHPSIDWADAQETLRLSPSPVRAPNFKDPIVQVRIINTDMYVAGEVKKAGNVAIMARSDAEALRSVGRVELII